MKYLRLLTLVAGGFLAASAVSSTHAAGQSAVKADGRTARSTGLFVSPSIVSVGQRVTLSVVAPVPSTVHISFRSAHHSFTGTAVYQRSSRSYVAGVYLIPRVHATERAQVVASITPRRTGQTYRIYGQFFIRGDSMPMNGIPQNDRGDRDGDNNGAPSDGDGGV